MTSATTEWISFSGTFYKQTQTANALFLGLSRNIIILPLGHWPTSFFSWDVFGFGIGGTLAPQNEPEMAPPRQLLGSVRVELRSLPHVSHLPDGVAWTTSLMPVLIGPLQQRAGWSWGGRWPVGHLWSLVPFSP